MLKLKPVRVQKPAQPAKPSKPLPQPAVTLTLITGYGLRRVGVRVALENPRVTRANHYLYDFCQSVFGGNAEFQIIHASLQRVNDSLCSLALCKFFLLSFCFFTNTFLGTLTTNVFHMSGMSTTVKGQDG